MVSPSNTQRQYTFGATEWTNYTKYRPRYPQSLIELIRSHHKRYSNIYNCAHDVASGCGVFVPVLAEDFGFKHIHVSDPGPENIQMSHQILSDWQASQRNANPEAQTTLTFSRTTGEDMHTCTASNTVDLVTIMEAAHWMDGPSLMASAAQTLKPGGTLAIVIYCIAAHIKDNDRANVAFKKAVGALWAHVLEAKMESNIVGVKELERGLYQACTGLDFVPIDHSIWKNVRRIRLRATGKGDQPNDIPWSEADHLAPSNVKPEDRHQHFNVPDEEAEGWDLDVDRDWFYGYFKSMEDPDHVAGMAEFKELMGVLEQEFQSRPISVEWVTDIILATRR